MKIFKFSIIFLSIVFAIGFIVLASMIIKQSMTDIMINDNVNTMAHNVKYKNPANIIDVPLIKQEINCGYACIEMLSEFLGGEGALTEEILFEVNNNKITTSTNNGLYAELKKRFPEYKITQYKSLKNSELIDRMYESISNGMPVIFSFAAVDDENEWTLHYGLAAGIDLPGDKITVVNPYGYTETYSMNDFLRATRFENYENMQFYLKLSFAAGMFSKNTLYIIEDGFIYETTTEEEATIEIMSKTEITE